MEIWSKNKHLEAESSLLPDTLCGSDCYEQDEKHIVTQIYLLQGPLFSLCGFSVLRVKWVLLCEFTFKAEERETRNGRQSEFAGKKDKQYQVS